MSQDRRGILVPLLRFALQTANEKPPQPRPRLPSAGHCPFFPRAETLTEPSASGEPTRDRLSSDPLCKVSGLGQKITAHFYGKYPAAVCKEMHVHLFSTSISD